MSHAISQTAGRAHHVTPLRVYIGVGTGLLVLTGATYAAAQFDLGSWNIVIALGIAACKAALVALFFMHLFYDYKLYAIVFGFALAFLAIFIGFTMADTEERGRINLAERSPIEPKAVIYDDAGRPIDWSNVDASALGGQLSEFEVKNGIGPITEPMSLGAVDAALAAKGEAIFVTKCGTCHKLDSRYTGPALRDVAKRRSPEFIMNQILNPEKMAKAHPEGKKLVAQYMTIMTFQNVSQDDARALLEYLRKASDETPSK